MKEIEGYEGIYAISESGQVFSIKKNRFGIPKNKPLKPHITDEGYLRVELNNKGGKKFTIHRLVALTYIENPNNLPQVNHKDGNKLNCHKDNLEWCTAEENIQHADALGLRDIKGEKHHHARFKVADIISIRKMCAERKLTQRQIGEIYGLDQRNVSRIYKGKSWKQVA